PPYNPMAQGDGDRRERSPTYWCAGPFALTRPDVRPQNRCYTDRIGRTVVRALGLSIHGCAGSRCCNSLAQARRSTFPRRTFVPVSSKGKPLAGGLPRGGLFPSCLWASHTRLSVG